MTDNNGPIYMSIWEEGFEKVRTRIEAERDAALAEVARLKAVELRMRRVVAAAEAIYQEFIRQGRYQPGEASTFSPVRSDRWAFEVALMAAVEEGLAASPVDRPVGSLDFTFSEELSDSADWPDVEQLRPHRGQWVMIDQGRVVVAGDTAREVLKSSIGLALVHGTLFHVPVEPGEDRHAEQ